MILFVDNYDSFSYSLVQFYEKLGVSIRVIKNDQVDVGEIPSLLEDVKCIVISPGPGRPNTSGICMELIAQSYKTHPILGVCLGHQCLAQFFGAEIVPAKTLKHGKSTLVRHDGRELFKDIPESFEAMRYNSLTVSPDHLSRDMDIAARSEEGEIMVIEHQTLPLVGAQFHPESIGTPEGENFLANCLRKQLATKEINLQ